MTNEPPASVERNLIERLLHVAAPSEQAFPAIFRDERAYLARATPPTRPGREDLKRLADLLIMLADKEDGVGMSYEAQTYRGLSGERLNLYGKRAHAAYRLLSDGRAYASQILALFDGAGHERGA